MSKLAITEVSMETCLLDMPYEILLEIFRRLPKGRLIEISRLCSEFRDVAKDTRLWKNVTISYDSANVAFEELYSGPCPVKGVDLQQAEINPPVSSKTDQLVKVTRLYLSFMKANEVIIKAILAKYQCTELYLDCTITIDNQGRMTEIGSEAFSKLTTLEVLGLRDLSCFIEPQNSFMSYCQVQLAPILSNCKNLKTLDLSHVCFSTNESLLGFVQSLPSSLEKFFLGYSRQIGDSFFQLLAKSTPNLKELELCQPAARCPSLHKFQFLETLYVATLEFENIIDLSRHLKKFPALKTVTVYTGDGLQGIDYRDPNLGKLRETLEAHGIVVKQTEHTEWWPSFQDDNLWKVLKTR